MAFFSIKNPLNDKLLLRGCTRFSGLTQGSVLDFFRSATQNGRVILREDIELEQEYIIIHNTLWASTTGFRWTEWILNCDRCITSFIAEELCSWILPPPGNSVMINGNKGYAESPNRKTWIGSNGDSDRGVFSFQSILLIEEFKKTTGIVHASWPFYRYVLKAIFLVAHSLNV